MKYIKTLLALTILTSFVGISSVSKASDTNTNAVVSQSQNDTEQWTFAVSGQGSTSLSSKNDATSIGGEFQIGHTGQFVLPFQAGVRQDIGYVSSGDKWNLSTKPYADWTLIKFWKLETDGGFNVGPTYGNQPLTWTGSPEVVQRLYVKKDVDLNVRAEYPINLQTGKTENQLLYTLGVEIRF